LKDKLHYDLGSLFRLAWRLLTNRNIRIVHIHTAAHGSFTKHLHYARVARLLGRRVILHCHGGRFADWYTALPARKQRRIVREINRLDKFIVLTASWREYYVSIGVKEGLIAIVNNIVPVPSAPLSKSLPGEPLRLLFLGDIIQRKGVFDLVQAMARVQSPAVLDIGGAGEEEALRALIASLGLEAWVHFHGYVAGAAKEELLARADVFVLPSYNEGLPISILEAMSYGCPVISTRVGGIPEVVSDNGILVDSGDPGALAAAVEALAEPSTRESMARKGLEAVKPYYPDAVMASLQAIYQSLL
jgi:glycosyltransferase involved in cell wall biosynthesis